MTSQLQKKQDSDAHDTALVCDFLRSTDDLEGWFNDAIIGNFDETPASEIVDIMESMDDAQVGRLFRERLVMAYLAKAQEREMEKRAARREWDHRESPESRHGVASLFRNNWKG